MARILIFGGHGKVALLTEPLLVAQGDQLRAVIRNPDHIADVATAGAQAVVADIETMDVPELVRLLTDIDAIVWSAGAGGGAPERTYAVDRDAAIRTMTAAEQAGVRRYVMVSWFGSTPDHGYAPEDSFFPYADAKLAADEHLRTTALEWTILAPSTLTLDPASGTIDATATRGGSVARADVAAVIVATLDDPTTIGRTIRFNAGTTPIRDAIRG